VNQEQAEAILHEPVDQDRSHGLGLRFLTQIARRKQAMPLPVSCPCGKAFQVKDEMAGRKIYCPACRAVLTVSAPVPTAQAVEEVMDALPAPDDDRRRDDDDRRRRDDDEDDDRRRRRRDDDSRDIDTSRIRKKRRGKLPKLGGEPFSLVDLLPMDHVLQSNLFAGLALIMQIVGVILLRSRGNADLGLVLVLVAIIPWAWGCAAYAKNKGYHEAVGLVGVFGLIGLIVLVCLPYNDRR
jgi:hypothetical protein